MAIHPDRLDEVARHLTDEPTAAKEVWTRLDCWAPGTIRKALEHLVEEGRAVRSSEPIPAGTRYLYRRAG